MYIFRGEKGNLMGDVRGVHIKQRQIAEPPFVVIMAVGDYQAGNAFQTMPAYLLKERRAAVYQITGLPYLQLIPDTFSHPRERTKVTEHPYSYAVNHFAAILAQKV